MLQAAKTGGVVCVAILSAVFCRHVADVSGAEAKGRTSERDLARQIQDATGGQPALIVHLGCGDGKSIAALRAGENCLVHGLDANADNVRKAREHLRKLGIYGPVSVDRFDGKQLPYAENLVNLLVAENLGGVTAEEALRVLAPGGTLLTKQGGRWRKTVKPRPENIDEWTHSLHDASGNAVAHDQVVGPPGSLQWSAGPRYTRSHEHIPSIYALVSTGERIFYIVDESSTASIRETPRWSLIARDAFNGLLLWKKPIGEWFPHIVNWGHTPNQLQRRLVAVGNRVYVTLGLHSPLNVVDAATGEVIDVFADTAGTDEVIWHKGILLLAVHSVTDERVAELAIWKQLVATKDSPVYKRKTAEPLVKRLRSTEAKGEKAILALDADSGRLLWKKDGSAVSGLRTLSLCANGDRVFYQAGGNVVCIDLKTGRDVWSESSGPLRVVCDDGVICADGKAVTALSTETGKTLWKQTASLSQIRDVFVIGDSVLVGGFKPWEEETTRKRKRGPAWGPYYATQRDLATGKILKHIEPDNPGHHHRCYMNKATDRYILAGRRGTEFIDLESGDVLWHSWARGVCRSGVMPCNGLLYVPPHACACYAGAKLIGFNALARGSRVESRESRARDRLERGPAYGEIRNPKSSIVNRQSSIRNPQDWPTYRGDPQRSGSTQSPVSAELRRRWQADVGDRLTAPTLGDGKVFVAAVDEHRVFAVDADSGRPAWHFTAGGRIDSPPTFYQGRAIFGCRDGYVYNVRAADGLLAWRLQAAREDRRVVVDGQLESVSPVHGSVLVRDDVAYVTAGRLSYMDGGIDLYRVEPGTGKVLSRTSVYSPDPETGRQPPQSAPSAMPGARSDILSSDDGHLYLRDMIFDHQGNKQADGSPHLFALTGFLDDSFAHRSYWIFGKKCSISTGCSRQDKNLVFGRLFCFDSSTVYGYGRKTVDWSNMLQDGPYRLFARKRAEGAVQWTKPVPIQVRAMVLAGKVLFLAGPPAAANGRSEAQDETQPAMLVAVSAEDGTVMATYPLDCPPVFDGMAAGAGRLYVALENGRLLCMEGKRTSQE